ncbi:MAG TPA: acyl-CoA dehydrogenase family protein [Burkholderiaceae bacterium]|jgi:putative acyl-CoA dehydrogenase|nr:acyl-CoA dehydrogenase family protein [Burkholderiaceae bacterium]
MSAATHVVLNQVPPYEDVNLFEADAALRDAVKFNAPSLATDGLSSLGKVAGSAGMQRHARLANLHAPVLHAHDRFGHRIDEVEFHPSYHVLLGAALHHRLHGSPWEAGGPSHVERAAGFMLFTELEPSVLCPVSMTYAVAPALRANAALQRAFSGLLASPRYDARFQLATTKTAMTMGMGMTEKQGGSDVRANTTQAVRDGADAWGERYRLVGHKWFMSAPMSDAFLVVAQTPAGPTCLFLPRWLPDGTLNAVRIQRLKDKLGNKANASSEVEFVDALAWRVGDEGRGLPQILAMGALTRLDCALGTAGLMRGAVSLALHHATHRMAFGKRLVEHALMRNVLADLALESEAATALALRLARAVDRSEDASTPAAEREHEALMRRLLTPAAKYWVCKRGSHLAQEAMECLGGNGYVEEHGEGVMARIYREMPLNSIWEGAGNIMALDLLRALRTGAIADALAHEMRAAKGAHPLLDRAAQRLLVRVENGVDEIDARRLARDLALVTQGTLLAQTAPAPVLAAFCESRLDGAPDAFGQLGSSTDFDAILRRAAAH